MQRNAGWIVFIAVVAGLGFVVWRVTHPAVPPSCEACARPIHAGSRTVALAGGRARQFCCPACALTMHRQSGQQVRILELTDYETEAKLAPGNAYVARNSDVNLCAHQHGKVDESQQPTQVVFDRCQPSLLAFARQEAAVRFVGAHGGEVVKFADLAAAYAQ